MGVGPPEFNMRSHFTHKSLRSPRLSRDCASCFGAAAYAGLVAQLRFFLQKFNYRYRVVQADAWFEELIHPDFGGYDQIAPAGGSAGYGGGTNVGGHVFGGAYALSDHATLGFTYFAQHLLKPSPVGSESATGRLQIDTNVKF